MSRHHVKLSCIISSLRQKKCCSTNIRALKAKYFYYYSFSLFKHIINITFNNIEVNIFKNVQVSTGPLIINTRINSEPDCSLNVVIEWLTLRFISGRTWVLISGRRPAVLTETFMGFLTPGTHKDSSLTQHTILPTSSFPLHCPLIVLLLDAI